MVLGAALLAPGAAAARDDGPKLSVNGHLARGFALADSGQAAGIGADGTSDYRRAALLFRYAPSGDGAVTPQVAHRRLGASPLQGLEPVDELQTRLRGTRRARREVPAGASSLVLKSPGTPPILRPSTRVRSGRDHAPETQGRTV
jgi:hypothetical protein